MKPFTWIVGGPYFKLVTDLSPEKFAREFTESVNQLSLIPTVGYAGTARIHGKLLSQDRFMLQE